jgi:hypothetical protein
MKREIIASLIALGLFCYGNLCSYTLGKVTACEKIYTSWYQKLDVKNIDAKQVHEGCVKEMK